MVRVKVLIDMAITAMVGLYWARPDLMLLLLIVIDVGTYSWSHLTWMNVGDIERNSWISLLCLDSRNVAAFGGRLRQGGGYFLKNFFWKTNQFAGEGGFYSILVYEGNPKIV